MKTLIVGRTKMGNSRCVGGLCDDGRSIRLLDARGHNWNVSAAFQIGHDWDLEFVDATSLRPPHVEDVLVTASTHVGNLQDVRGAILARVQPWRGSTSVLFGGLVNYTGKHNGYIESAVPRSKHLVLDSRQGSGAARRREALRLSDDALRDHDSAWALVRGRSGPPADNCGRHSSACRSLAGGGQTTTRASRSGATSSCPAGSERRVQLVLQSCGELSKKPAGLTRSDHAFDVRESLAMRHRRHPRDPRREIRHVGSRQIRGEPSDHAVEIRGHRRHTLGRFGTEAATNPRRRQLVERDLRVRQRDVRARVIGTRSGVRRSRTLIADASRSRMRSRSRTMAAIVIENASSAVPVRFEVPINWALE